MDTIVMDTTEAIKLLCRFLYQLDSKNVAAVLTDTDELKTDFSDGDRLDIVLDDAQDDTNLLLPDDNINFLSSEIEDAESFLCKYFGGLRIDGDDVTFSPISREKLYQVIEVLVK
jgi:hypothetical protein